MGRPQRVSDEDILEAARQAFHREGERASLATIAAGLGISAAALAQRVGSKEALLERALRSPVPEVLTRLARAPTRAPKQELEEVLVALGRFLEAQLPSLVVLRSAGLTRAGTAPTPVVLRRALSRWLAQVKTRVAPDLAAEALLGVLEARAFNRYVGGPAAAPGAERRLIRRLLDELGVAPLRGGRR
ncbi:MAG: TetR/AcrR family transcriptional regulator [Myxococcota bacterium]